MELMEELSLCRTSSSEAMLKVIENVVCFQIFKNMLGKNVLP